MAVTFKKYGTSMLPFRGPWLRVARGLDRTLLLACLSTLLPVDSSKWVAQLNRFVLRIRRIAARLNRAHLPQGKGQCSTRWLPSPVPAIPPSLLPDAPAPSARIPPAAPESGGSTSGAAGAEAPRRRPCQQFPGPTFAGAGPGGGAGCVAWCETMS